MKRLLRRCLERDARRRLGWIGDARLELEDAGSMDGRESASTAAATVAAIAPAWRRALPLTAAALGGAVIVGILGSLDGWGRAQQGAAPVIRLTIEASAPEDVAISPDGTRVLIRRGRALEIRSMSAFESVPLKIPDLPGPAFPVFSPDGQSIAFSSLTTLKRIPAAGGVVADIAELPASSDGCSWSGDHLYCAVGDQGIVRVAATGGPVEQVIPSWPPASTRPHPNSCRAAMP